MAREREIKIKLKNMTLGEFEKRIVEKGFELEKTIEQLDVYFDTKDWYLYDHIAALRLRKVDGKDHSFSFKKVFWLPKKTDPHYVEEIEIHAPFLDTKKLGEIFKRVGLEYKDDVFENGGELVKYLAKQEYLDNQRMPKTRKIYKKDRDEIVIDNIDQVGIIIELECEEQEPLEVVKNILDDNEWERSFEATGYSWLKRVKGLDRHEKNLERLKVDPDWNVWEWEKEYYKKISE